jgi:hypothetical protein
MVGNPENRLSRMGPIVELPLGKYKHAGMEGNRMNRRATAQRVNYDRGV